MGGWVSLYPKPFQYLTVLITGSPADKADLEVADEILEINGKALQNCSHTEVIAHIHNVSYPHASQSGLWEYETPL